MLTGVVSSILATVVVGLVSWVCIKYVVPWYRAKSYQGVNLSAEWGSVLRFDESDGTREIAVAVRLKQVGSEVSGAMEWRHNGTNGSGFLIHQELKGSVSGDRLQFHAQSIDRSYAVLTDGILNVERAGKSLRGHVTVSNPFASGLVSKEVVWTRY